MIVRHGLSIGERTHGDQQTMTPMIDSALDGVAEHHVEDELTWLNDRA